MKLAICLAYKSLDLFLYSTHYVEATRRRASTGSEHKSAAEISWYGGDTSDGQVSMECYRWKVCAEKSWRGSKLES